MAHDYLMLSTKDTRAKNPTGVTVSLEAELRFVSENQRLEGFSGEITEAVRRYQPSFEELKAVSERFGAQIPKPVSATKG